MTGFRFREEESSSTGTIVGLLAGAAAGFALGLYVTKRYGGIDGIAQRVRKGRKRALAAMEAMGSEDDDLYNFDDDDLNEEAADEGEEQDMDLEFRVLEAFRNDPVLSERAVDIGAIGTATIELAGWVETEREAELAVTVARGVPGVDNVVNRLSVGPDEEQFDENAKRFREADPALKDGQWEGNTVGIGKRRQGRSDQPDRHADPRVDLEERWSATDQALKHAADDL
jgi:hypothetical protein